MKITFVLFTLFLSAFSFSSDASIKEEVAKAEVQSCSGCSLRSLPDVKSFIFEDVPLYEGVEFKNIPRAPPELVLFDEEFKELKRIPLRELSRKECNNLLEEWGFEKKEQKSEL